MRRLLMLVVSASMLAGLAVVVPSVVSPDKAPQAQAHDWGRNGVRGNGCTSPFGDSPGGFWFHNVCDLHDTDYRNRPDGATAQGRLNADWRFYARMWNECEDYRFGTALQRCRAWAWTYYQGVRKFGWLYYYDVSPLRRAEVGW